MLDKISTKIVNNWIESNIIDISDKEVYEYGIVITIEYLASLITTAIIAIFSGEIIASATFYVGFKYLRSYAGGIHAKTFLGCYISSSLIILISVLLIKYNYISIFVYRICGLLASVYLINTRPVDNENKRASKEEKLKFNRSKNIVLLIISLIILISVLHNISIVEKSLESAVIIVSICCIFAYLYL